MTYDDEREISNGNFPAKDTVVYEYYYTRHVKRGEDDG
jgi:hypothetical protein